MSIASRILKLSGWTPIGKTIEIEIDESSLPLLLGKILLAKIVALNSNGSADIDLLEPIEYGAKMIQAVIAEPRHKGYDFFHIGVGNIAVDLKPIASERDVEKQDTRFAMGVIAIKRKTKGPGSN